MSYLEKSQVEIIAPARRVASLRAYLSADADQQIAGCTHYPLSQTVLDEVMGPEVKIVENGP